MLCRLAAEQRAARELAPVGDAANDVLAGRDVQLAGREVVEKEERLGAGRLKRIDLCRHEGLIVLAGADTRHEADV